MLFPAWIVTGKEIPLTTKAVLFELAPVTVTLPPLAVKVPDACTLFPTTTLPIPRLLGLAPSWALTIGMPVPEKGTVRVELRALDVIAIFPLAIAAVVGEKLTPNVAACPATRVSGAEIPLMVNPDPLVEI